jgi:hypothetical protein
MIDDAGLVGPARHAGQAHRFIDSFKARTARYRVALGVSHIQRPAAGRDFNFAGNDLAGLEGFAVVAGMGVKRRAVPQAQRFRRLWCRLTGLARTTPEPPDASPKPPSLTVEGNSLAGRPASRRRSDRGHTRS